MALFFPICDTPLHSNENSPVSIILSSQAVASKRYISNMVRKNRNRPCSTPVSKNDMLVNHKHVQTEAANEERCAPAAVLYQDIIRRRIEEEKQYPHWAQKNGITGSAYLSFDLLGDGSCRNIRIVQSSGSEILDEEAVNSIRRAAPFPPIPVGIGRNSLSMKVSLVFTIK